MRQDWDFVSMQDYQADMAEQSAMGAALITAQRREIENLKRTIWNIVKAAGGRVEVDAWDLRFSDKDWELITWENPASMRHVFVAKRREQ